MPEQSEDFTQVRDAIACALYDQDPDWQPSWDDLPADSSTKEFCYRKADAVLDALGLEQVGWRCKHGLSEGRCGPRPDEPVTLVRSPTRPERHFHDSLVTLRILFAREVLVRWLPRCPACLRVFASRSRAPCTPRGIRDQ